MQGLADCPFWEGRRSARLPILQRGPARRQFGHQGFNGAAGLKNRLEQPVVDLPRLVPVDRLRIDDVSMLAVADHGADARAGDDHALGRQHL